MPTILFNCKAFFFFLAKSDRDRYSTRIKKIGTRYGLNVSYQQITREEKDLIVKAMGLTQGHWFKCPKGRPEGKYFFSKRVSYQTEHSTAYATPKEHAHSGFVFPFFLLTAMIKLVFVSSGLVSELQIIEKNEDKYKPLNGKSYFPLQT